MTAPSVDPEMLAAGTVFGHYEIVRHLGSGGMGAVYEARHSQLGKRVVIKTLLAAYAANPDSQTRFLREGKLAAKLHHPHVVDVTDFGIESGVPYLVMEFLEGEDLAALLAREGPLSPSEIADMLVPVIAAVASAHDEKIVHRDLKPENIFLTRSSSGERVPKVLDFGISKLLGDAGGANLTGSMNLLGTPVYMSQEQARSAKHVDDRSDQYALALMIYECATGQIPFEGDSVFKTVELIVAGNFTPPSQLVDGLPTGFEALVLRGMAHRPADRFASTWELGAALLPFASLRHQMAWEAEFKGKSSTFVGGVLKKTASSSAIRSVSASVPRDENAMNAATALDAPNPLARPRSEPRIAAVAPKVAERKVDRSRLSTDENDPATLRNHAAYQDDAPAPASPPRQDRPTPPLPGGDDLALAGLAPRRGWLRFAIGGALALTLLGAWWVASGR